MTLSVAHVVIFVLAVWRISSLFVREAGPFRAFEWIREQAGIQHDEYGVPWIIPDTYFAQLLGCVWCFSLWVGTGFAIFLFILPEIALKIAIVFAFSAGAILLDVFLQKQR